MIAKAHTKLDLSADPKFKEVRVEFYPGAAETHAGELYIEVDGGELAITRVEMTGGMLQIKIEERWG